MLTTCTDKKNEESILKKTSCID